MNDENLKPFKKGHDPRRNNNGRKPKVYTILKELGYGNDDIKACFKELMWYEVTELKELEKAKGTPIIKAIMAKSLLTDLSKGNLNNTREFLLRLMGAPRQEIRQENVGSVPAIIVKTTTEAEEIKKLQGDTDES